jgi:signal transduction histidine kinase
VRRAFAASGGPEARGLQARSKRADLRSLAAPPEPHLSAERKIALALGLLLVGTAALQALVSFQRANVALEHELEEEQRQLAQLLAKAPALATLPAKTKVRRVSLSPLAPESEQPLLARHELAPLFSGGMVQVTSPTEAGERLLTYAALPESGDSAVELSRLLPLPDRSTTLLGAGAFLLVACAAVAGMSGFGGKKQEEQPEPLPSEAFDRLEQLNHLGVVGTLAAGIIHDIGTPLNVISGRAMMLAAPEATPAEIAENANTIRQQCQKIAGMVRSLLTFARRTNAGMPERLADVVRDDVALFEPIARSKKVKIELNVASADAGTHVERAELRQILANILMNGLQVMPNGGRLVIDVGVSTSLAGREGEWAFVGISDAGKGIAAEDVDRIFQPFFTTQPQREGAGLGLAVARRVLARHGGFIDVKSERNNGTRFTVYLPQRSPK